MDNEILKKKAEELEQTLNMQLSLIKRESEDWVKVGGTVLAGSVTALLLYRLFGKRKNNKTDRVLRTLEREGLLDDDIKDRLTKKNKGGFFRRIGSMVLPLAINYGKDQIKHRFEQSQRSQVNEKY